MAGTPLASKGGVLSLIVDSVDKMITFTKNMLNSRFDMKDLDLVDVILGIKIKRASDGLILH